MQNIARAQLYGLRRCCDRLLVNHDRDMAGFAAFNNIFNHPQVFLVCVGIRYAKGGPHIVRPNKHRIDTADVKNTIKIPVGRFGFNANYYEGFLAAVLQILLGFRALPIMLPGRRFMISC